MTNLDRKYLISALIYAGVGMTLGIFMGASHNHGQFVTHAHILLVGFVASLLYAVIHKLWLAGGTSVLATVQFLLHQAGAVIITIGLFLLYGNFAPAPLLDPVLAVASIAVLGGALLMLLMVARLPAARSP